MDPHAGISMRFRRRATHYVKQPMSEDPGGKQTQDLDVLRSVVPGILCDLLICVCRSQLLPWSTNKSFPGSSSDESFSNFDGGDHSLDVKIGVQITNIDYGRIKWILTP